MIKAIGENLIIGTGVVFGGVDLTGDRFTKNTDFGESRSFVGLPVYYDHSLGGLKSQIGAVKQWIPTDEGIDVEIELDRRHAYASKVMELVKRGALGLSTGALPHLVVRENGELKRWVMPGNILPNQPKRNYQPCRIFNSTNHRLRTLSTSD